MYSTFCILVIIWNKVGVYDDAKVAKKLKFQMLALLGLIELLCIWLNGWNKPKYD